MTLDLIATILMLIGATAPLAILLSWLATRGHGGLGVLLGSGQKDSWARLSMPLPRGVQEDDEIRFNFTPLDQPDVPSTVVGGPDPVTDAEVAIDLVRVRPAVHLRPRSRRG